nr:hypothetical protein JVH1_7512 [Rhodococcus sp. JVH1]
MVSTGGALRLRRPWGFRSAAAPRFLDVTPAFALRVLSAARKRSVDTPRFASLCASWASARVAVTGTPRRSRSTIVSAICSDVALTRLNDSGQDHIRELLP